ncbi:HAUS augmin-like complex subunit 1 [Paramuricea clavata]|uniref:HAUS augmin-like complex subunit 1 n=1 Tax=Paramuricea clavata TaxID=317549 RepID=A0A6S7G2L1_PARCT|nr:HAUS augmin-like complex subunit 1 [Paramuricea clavata]
MNEQHQKVRAWLETLFVDEPIPTFEINSKTIEILSTLVDINRKKDQDAKILTEDLAQKKNEYRSEAKRLQRIISSVGLPLSNLSQSGLTSVRTLASTALLLDLRDTKMSSYLLGINELSKELHSAKEEEIKSKHATTKQLQKTNKALIQYNSLKKACETLEEQISLQEPILKQRLRDTGFLNQKTGEYQRQLDQLLSYQKQANLEPALYHKALEKKYEDVVKLEEDLKPLKSKLDTYHSLPPDISLAKVRLEEARRELQSLEEQLTRNIDSMHSM